MNHVLFNEDALRLISLHNPPVLVPHDLHVLIDVGGHALEGKAVSFEHDLTMRRRHVERGQLKGRI